MYLTFDTGKNQYDCCLNTRALVDAEAVLKTNPLNIFTIVDDGDLPKLSDLLIILYMSMKKFNHGIKTDDIYDIYDDYVANGGSLNSLMEFIMNLFIESGTIKVDKDTEQKESTEGTSKN